MTNGRINKRSALLAILCVLVMVFAVPVASAASYSKVYGQTQDKGSRARKRIDQRDDY